MEILTLEEAAAELGKSTKWLRIQCNKGELRARKCGHSWVLLRDDLDAYRNVERHPGRPRKDTA